MRRRVHVSVTFDKRVVEQVDRKRGYIPRSLFIELLLKEALARGIDRELTQKEAEVT